MNWRPKDWIEWKLYALLMTLIDTGARIDIELLRLERKNVDFDNLLIKLDGKGGKERYVPMSNELRKALWRWLQKHEHDLVFPTRTGTKMLYRNVFREFSILCKRLGIEGDHNGFHK